MERFPTLCIYTGITLVGCIVWNAHNTVFNSKCSAISNSGFLGPTPSSQRQRHLDRFSRGSLNDRPTDHATWLVTIGGIYVRSTVMWSNNKCSISRLSDRFPCFYYWTVQGNRRQQTSLRLLYGIARLTMYFLNLRPVNAKLTLLSYVHEIIAPPCNVQYVAHSAIWWLQMCR